MRSIEHSNSGASNQLPAIPIAPEDIYSKLIFLPPKKNEPFPEELSNNFVVAQSDNQIPMYRKATEKDPLVDRAALRDSTIFDLDTIPDKEVVRPCMVDGEICDLIFYGSTAPTQWEVHRALSVEHTYRGIATRVAKSIGHFQRGSDHVTIVARKKNGDPIPLAIEPPTEKELEKLKSQEHTAHILNIADMLGTDTMCFFSDLHYEIQTLIVCTPKRPLTFKRSQDGGKVWYPGNTSETNMKNPQYQISGVETKENGSIYLLTAKGTVQIFANEDTNTQSTTKAMVPTDDVHDHEDSIALSKALDINFLELPKKFKRGVLQLRKLVANLQALLSQGGGVSANYNLAKPQEGAQINVDADERIQNGGSIDLTIVGPNVNSWSVDTGKGDPITLKRSPSGNWCYNVKDTNAPIQHIDDVIAVVKDKKGRVRLLGASGHLSTLPVSEFENQTAPQQIEHEKPLQLTEQRQN